MNNTAKNIYSKNISAGWINFGSLGIEDSEHSGFGFVEISEIFFLWNGSI